MGKLNVLGIVIGSFFIILLIVFALIMYINPGPTVEQTEETEWLATMPIAHRGFHTDDSIIPENSMAAFEKALELGYAIELDVLLTADGEVVVFHDYDLLRMTGVDALVSEMNWDEIKHLTLLDSEETIPLLSDVLELVDGKVPLLIEIKNEDSVGELEDALLELVEHYDGLFAIQAFNPFVLEYIKNQAPHIIRGQLASNFKEEDLAFYEKFLLRYLLLNFKSEPHFVGYRQDDIPQWLANRMQAKNVYLLAWTVVTEEDAERAMEMYDNIIFELFYPHPVSEIVEVTDEQ